MLDDEIKIQKDIDRLGLWNEIYEKKLGEKVFYKY